MDMKHLDDAMAMVHKMMDGPEMSPAEEDATMKKMMAAMKAHKKECMAENKGESAVNSTLSGMKKMPSMPTMK